MKKKLITLTLVLGLALLHGTVLLAQSVLEGKITGTVTDENGELLPGVSVEITGVSIMGKRATVTSAKGAFVFLNVPPGKIVMTVSLAGFKTWIQDNLILGAGSTLEVNPSLQAGAIEEQVTVTAASPIVDVKTSTVDSRLESEMLAKLPSTRDAFYDMALMTPGMFEVGSSGSWLPSPTAYGGSSMENVFLVNGVNTTNPRGASFGSLVKVNYNAVEEVRVVALGSKAEYGSFSGAAIDVLTRSGSNKFHGNAAYYTELRGDTFFKTNQPKDGPLAAPDNWLFVQQGDVLAGVTKKNWEGNFTLGGPIIKDKIWFYGAFDYIRSGTLPVNWSILNEWWGRYLDLKVSAEPFAKSRAWVSYHREWNRGTGWSWGTEPEWDTSMTYGKDISNDTLSAQLQWLPTSNAIFTAKYLGFWTNEAPFIPDDHPDHPGYINWWKWARYGINGAFPYVESMKSNRQTVQADVSYYVEDFLGEHDIKFGAQYTKGRGNWMGGYFQNYANFTYPLGYPAYAFSGGNLVGADMNSWKTMWYWSWWGWDEHGPVDPEDGLVFFNRKDTLNPFLTVRTADSLGFFIDDQWSPTKRLTLNLGLRFDRMTTKYGAGKIYELLDEPSDINGPPPVLRDRASSDNLFDFRTFSPRFGVTYQLTKDGKTVFRANYGRYYMPLAVEFLRRFGPDMPQISRDYQWWQIPWDLVDLNGNDVVDFRWYEYGGEVINEVIEGVRQIRNQPGPVYDQLESVDPSWSLNVADDVKDMHTDQIMVNLERELFKDFSLSATYIYKHSANLFVNIPIERATQEEWIWERISYKLANEETVSLYSVDLDEYGGDLTYVRENYENSFRVENMQTYDGIKPHRTYQAFQFVLNKRYSNRWQGLASLVYSWSDGTAQRTMRQNDNMMGPMITDDTWMSSLNDTVNNMEGPLPFVPKWELKTSGSYTIPGIEVDLGARFRFSTGRPLWRLYPIPSGLWGGPITAGGLGRVVGDADPTYMPSLYILDLRAEKGFRIKNYGSFHVVLDAFNIFNAANVTNADFYENWGRITGVSDARRFRLSFMFQF